MSKHRNKLGRRFAPDPRDMNHLMAHRMAAPEERTSRKWQRGGHLIPLDQGQTGTCTAHGASHFLLVSPVRNTLPCSPYDLYRKEVLVDEWPDNDHEATAPDSQLQAGSSVRAAMKVLQTLGYLTEYAWAFDGKTARQWVLQTSPVVLGVDWYSGMDDVDEHGFLYPKGRVDGGHCFLWYGTDLKEKRPDGGTGVDYFLNSWGRWGIGGKGVFKLRTEDTDALIAAQGEAATATEQLALVQRPS